MWYVHIIGASLSKPHSDVMYAGRVCGWIYLCCIRLPDNILTGDIRSADKVFTASIFGNES